MIGRLTGTPNFTDSGVLFDVNGVGYDVQVSSRTRERLKSAALPVSLDIQMKVSEEAILLYGFSSDAEKLSFQLLTQVAGIGGKVGLALLSAFSPEELRAAIETNATERLVAVPGVGKKLAERICLELRDKIRSLPMVMSSDPFSPSQYRGDALSALLNLGIPRAQAEAAIARAERMNPGSVEALIRDSLKGVTS